MKKRPKIPLSDEEIIEEIIEKGRSDLYEVIFDRYSDKVYRKCLSFVGDKMTAQDMVQDIFLKVFFQLIKFKRNSRFSTWLYAITYNFCIEHYRKNSRWTPVEIDEKFDLKDDSLEEQELFAIRVDLLKKAMDKVDPNDKMILLMKYQDNISIKEIMEQLQITESAVKMRLSRARERVKKFADDIASKEK